MDVVAIEDGDGAILPTWTAVDNNNVRTSRELWEYMKSEGWHVEVSVTIRAVLTQVLSMNHISIIGECVAVFEAEVLTRFSIPISPNRPIEVCIPSFFPLYVPQLENRTIMSTRTYGLSRMRIHSRLP